VGPRGDRTCRKSLSVGKKVAFVNSLLLTAAHPFQKSQGDQRATWQRPKEVTTVITLTDPVPIFNFVLSAGGTLRVNGIVVATLGDDAAAAIEPAHPYYGTSSVVDDLRKLPSWPNCSKSV